MKREITLTAIPKRNDPRTWSKAGAASTSVVIKPTAWNPPAETVAPRVIRKKSQAAVRSLPGSLFGFLVRNELPISIVAIIAFAIGASIAAGSALSARTQVRDTRIAVQRLENEIGFLEKELENEKNSLEESDTPESHGTLPIEAGDVVTVTLPPIQ